MEIVELYDPTQLAQRIKTMQSQQYIICQNIDSFIQSKQFLIDLVLNLQQQYSQCPVPNSNTRMQHYQQQINQYYPLILENKQAVVQNIRNLGHMFSQYYEHSQQNRHFISDQQIIKINRIMFNWLTFIETNQKSDYLLINDLISVLMKFNRNSPDSFVNLVNDILNFLAMDLENNPVFVIFNNTLLYLVIDRTDGYLFTQTINKLNMELFMNHGLEQNVLRVQTMFNNLIKTGLSNNIIMFIHQFCVKLYHANTIYCNIVILFQIYESIIKQLYCILKCQKYFERVLDLICYFIFGFQNNISLDDELVSSLENGLELLNQMDQNSRLDIVHKYYQILLRYENKGLQQNVKQKLDRYVKTNGLVIDRSLIQQKYQDIEQNRVFRISQQQLNELNTFQMNKQMMEQQMHMKYLKGKSQFKGIFNKKNQCYIISFIQSLFLNQQFNKFIIDIFKDYDYQMNSNLLIYQLCMMFYRLDHSTADGKDINLDSLQPTLPSPFNISDQQEDVNELQFMMFDKIETELNRINKKLSQKYSQFFQINRQQSISCTKCKKVSTKSEILQNLICFMDEKCNKFDLLQLMNYNMVGNKDTISNVECSQCKIKVEMEQKAYKYHKLAPILIVTLNRYKQNGEKNMADIKICRQFKLCELIKSCKQDGMYKLYSVIFHSGSSQNSGHYYTVGRQSNQSDQWSFFNDNEVLVLDDEYNFQPLLGSSDTPFMFFYMADNHQGYDL